MPVYWLPELRAAQKRFPVWWSLSVVTWSLEGGSITVLCSCVHWILTEYINRSNESAIDQTLGCCQLSEIIGRFINDMVAATTCPLLLWKEKAGGCAPAESHNQIIALDSSFVYQAVTKEQLLSKNSYEAESSDDLRCLIPAHSKPLDLKTCDNNCECNLYTRVQQSQTSSSDLYFTVHFQE